MSDPEQREFFQRNGYVIVEGHLPPARLAALRTAVEERYAAEGARAGWEQPAVAPFVRRLCNLFSKGTCSWSWPPTRWCCNTPSW